MTQQAVAVQCTLGKWKWTCLFGGRGSYFVLTLLVTVLNTGQFSCLALSGFYPCVCVRESVCVCACVHACVRVCVCLFVILLFCCVHRCRGWSSWPVMRNASSTSTMPPAGKNTEADFLWTKYLIRLVNRDCGACVCVGGGCMCVYAPSFACKCWEDWRWRQVCSAMFFFFYMSGIDVWN